ncbi:DUF4232 domain-containing protein [Microbispora bryophytorum]|uniref:DUF4232 domain-containing protein n=1 Tax=Microbispora bryophytorum TaxID=1460882 RepID=A0A8H9LHL1_9ACTN|nr:DUF4232 domain-containing protein [Microbispora bryophytorum]MBD3141113.1 DUF4232 domain-containing protein [Microbispora bryophytorum]TQR99838.1 DUF4232 domain-containing protein [Microbispora bryophytorum]GGO31777.1 hypothetical protein GCM10011574_70020 [Microbispora bryophytorum]
MRVANSTLTAAAAALALLAAGCGTGTTPSAAATPPAKTTTPHTTTPHTATPPAADPGRATAASAASARYGAAARTTTTGSTPTQSAGAASQRCRTTGLRARVGRQDPGAGNRYAPLVLTNTSGKTCWVYGFVGLVLIDGRGDVLRTRTRRESVTPHRVSLRPGASAHARLHWTVVPSGHETRCPSSARLMIIPPDEVAHLEVPFPATVCDDGRIDARPMAPGASL